ncbi:MAG: N-acyl-D-amino-acid deacylase family protein [Candidatus Dormibacteria bacterium]
MPEYSALIRGGQVLDGTGAPAHVMDLGVTGDRIAAVGGLTDEAKAPVEIDATGMVVAPGFVNMLSHAYYSLLQDGRGLADLLQGITTEVFSEEPPVGPMTEEMRERTQHALDAGGYDRVRVTWSSVAEYLALLEESGTAPNVCTFMSTWAVRECAMGLDQRDPTAEELRSMVRMVEEQMDGGALGIGSALIYPPANYMTTGELVELCRAAGRHGGRYHSHIRSEGDGLLPALAELLEIGERADVPVELQHVKVAGQENWPKLDAVLAMLDDARAKRPVSANMYTFNAGGTALYYAIPARFHDGGPDRLRERLRDAAIRSEVRAEIETGDGDWENLYRMSGGATGVLLLATEAPEFKRHCGSSLQEIGAELGRDPIDVLMDIALIDETGAGAAYFIISEDNVRREVQVPWITFGSDAGAGAVEKPFTRYPTHPREYGNFARLLGHYVRDEKLLTLAEAVRRLTSLPCATLGLAQRGRLAEGFFADVVIFDPATIGARATYKDSHQYATGMRDVLVNGVPVLREGKATGSMPGRVLRGQG